MTLADAFWPGPLSVVVEANDSVPEIVRAGSPTVALRSPSNPFFLDVLKNLGEGIAAPSANQFGHISPTSARDVAEEFSESDLLVCDAGDCDVGIESTVLRVYKDGQMRILRPGRVTQSAIEVALSNFETLFSDGFWKSKEQSLALNLKTVGAESPGQLVKHYAPKQDTYLVSKSVENAGGSDCLGKQLALEKTVIIDFDSEFLYAKNKFLKYLNPAPKGDLNQFMRSLFSELRRAEKVSEAETILIYFPKEFYDQRSIAISDRLRRASSGKTAVWELSSGRARVFSSTL